MECPQKKNSKCLALIAVNILSPEEVNQFVEEGFVWVRNAFSSTVAAECREEIWKTLELSPSGVSSVSFCSLYKYIFCVCVRVCVCVCVCVR